jgi:hypothetical protein
MNIRYRVDLSEPERLELEALLSGGKHAARKLERAQILLAADAGASDETIAVARAMSGSPHRRTRPTRIRDRRMAATPEPLRHPNQMELYNNQRARKARSRLSRHRQSVIVSGTKLEAGRVKDHRNRRSHNLIARQT